MLTAEQIAEQQQRYACCSFDHLVKSMQADIVGETARATKEFNIALKAYWAYEVVSGNSCTVLEVPTDVDCLCEKSYGCSCPDQDCTILPDLTVVVVPCSAPVSGWVITGAGTKEANGVFLETTPIPEAEPGTTTFVTEGGTYLYVPSADPTYFAIAETPGTYLYHALSLTGPWIQDTGDTPVPTSAAATLGDLCETSLTPSQQLTLAVTSPEDETVYAFDCCGQMQFEIFTLTDGFDYELDSPMN